MTRAERLLELYMILRARRTVVTADRLAALLDVSARTVYRDVQALRVSGFPIDGEAGIGYVLRRGFELPPLMFTPEEALALSVGVRFVRAFTDPDLSDAADTADRKIRSVLTDDTKYRLDHQPYRMPVLPSTRAERDLHGLLRAGCEGRLKLRFMYESAKGEPSERLVWPLSMVAWSGRWTLLAWCESRDDYRNFRFDRMKSVFLTDSVFPQSDDRSVDHYYRTVLGIPADEP